MPIPKLCSHPSCRNISRDGNHRCHLHRKGSYKPNKEVQERSVFYNTTAWTKFSKRIRASRPVCEICDNDLTKDLDHWLERSIAHNTDYDFDERNMVCMCHKCHFNKSVKMRSLINSKEYHKIYQWLLNNHPRKNDTSYLHDWIRSIEIKTKEGEI